LESGAGPNVSEQCSGAGKVAAPMGIVNNGVSGFGAKIIIPIRGISLPAPQNFINNIVEQLLNIC